MPRPTKTFTDSEDQAIRDAWTETQTVDGTRAKYAELMRLDKSPTWDTMRRWLDLLGLRDDPSGRNEKLKQRSLPEEAE